MLSKVRSIKRGHQRLLLLSSILLAASCSSNKTIYINNKHKDAITLSMDSNYHGKNVFADSLDGKKIGAHLILHFGKGKWSKNDKIQLEKTLRHTAVNSVDSIEERSFRPTIRVNYIRLFVEELLVTIK